MPKVKIQGRLTKDNVTRPMGMNVLEAAKFRINKILDRYDHVGVSFSGGKDSLAVMHLLKQVKEERGEEPIVDCVFRDEELIPDSVINFVDHYRQLPWVRMKWFAVPLKSNKCIFGKTVDYLQWDPNREHVRPIPEWAITAAPGQVFDQYSMDDEVAKYYPGKICMMTGIRTSEGFMRYRAIINKINETFVCATQSPRVDLGRPVYDWEEADVFRFFYDYNIEYAEIYDQQVFAKQALRVSTPLHSEGSKRLGKWREIDPVFYDRVLQLFPEMGVQDLYNSDIKSLNNGLEDPTNWDELGFWIREKYSDDQLTTAMQRYREVMSFIKNPRVRDSYPFTSVLKKFKSGTIKRVFLPESKR